jgi:hypothetical protein
MLIRGTKVIPDASPALTPANLNHIRHVFCWGQASGGISSYADYHLLRMLRPPLTHPYHTIRELIQFINSFVSTYKCVSPYQLRSIVAADNIHTIRETLDTSHPPETGA